MKKLSEALQELGLDQSFFDELKADIEAERIITENGELFTNDDTSINLRALCNYDNWDIN